MAILEYSNNLSNNLSKHLHRMDATIQENKHKKYVISGKHQ